VPKEEKEQLHQLSEASAAALGAALPRVAVAILRATGAKAYNVLQNNGALAHQAVMHVHFHIIPRLEDGRGLGVGWKASPLDQTAGADLARRICQELR
jgi:histidine triad (HIT) family protein